MPVTIALTGAFSDELLDYLDRQISLFEAENPDIRVAILSAPQREDRRRAAFSEQLAQADPSADLYAVDPAWLAAFDALGGLAPLDGYMAQHGISSDEFFEPAARAGSLDGRTVALPWSIDGGVLYYRRDLVPGYGYEPPLDWPALQEAALDVQSGEGLPAGFVWQGAAYESLTCNALEVIWAYGGQVLDAGGWPVFDSAATRAGLQQMADLISLGASPPEVSSYREFDARTRFEGGEAALMRHWASLWPRLEGSQSLPEDRIGVASLPTSCLGGLQLALSAHSLNPEQASRFLAFLVGPTPQVQLALEAGQLPALDTVYQDAQLLAANPRVAELREALSPARLRPVSPIYAAISEAIYTEVNAMLLGSQDADTTAANVQRRLQSLP
jgi:multiple sugar transport system substrate-binding protein